MTGEDIAGYCDRKVDWEQLSPLEKSDFKFEGAFPKSYPNNLDNHLKEIFKSLQTL